MLAAPIDQFQETLRTRGLHAALQMLNGRGAHRFTGVYRFEGEWLRNVALFDRWNPELTQGDDAPMRQTFCAIVPSQGDSLEVTDNTADARFPWMSGNAVLSYCGTLIHAETGGPFGTICHFDLLPCESTSTEFPLLLAAAPLIYRAIADGSRSPS